MLLNDTITIAEEVGRMRPIERLTRPFQEFAAREASGGILLLLLAFIAIVWANSAWSASYFALWHSTLSANIGNLTFGGDLHFWVNDGLMAVFFFVVGLEVKRELLTGELASPRRAALPIIAAIGGVVAPALVYWSLNAGTAGAPGWGIPMATDIAFVMGALALLGSRAPAGLKMFLTALAIVDDIAAVIVIAVFYTPHIEWSAAALAGLCFAALLIVNRLGVRHPLPYGLLGLVLWTAVFASGIHATIAGVTLAIAIPSRAELDPRQFLHRSRVVLDRLEGNSDDHATAANDRQAAIHVLRRSIEQAQSPLQQMEHVLHPWVTLVIMPLFALANAGVPIGSGLLVTLMQPVPLGVILGLVLGKPIGITFASWLAVRMRLAALPAGVSWGQLNAAGWLGGIGFTMSIFVTGLAFMDDGLLNGAKLGVFTASLLAAMAGSAILLCRPAKSPA